MKLIGTTNTNVSCIWTTIGKSIENLGKFLNLDTIIYDDIDFKNKKIKKVYHNEKVIFIFEAGTPQHSGYSMKDMKELFPNSVFIALSSDAIIYLKQHKVDQLDYEYVDVLLDVEDEAIKYYKSKYPNLIGEKWLWTISTPLMAACDEFRNINIDKFKNDVYDFILVATKSGVYRQGLFAHLNMNGISITNGGGRGHNDNDLERLFTHYMQSAITLGTTSHNNPKIRGMKGFRDCIGPFLGAPLIYDDYPQVIGSYGSILPYYDFNNYDSIIDIRKSLSKETLQELCNVQTSWIRLNTIEEQLFKVIKKYGIL